jgi:transposase
MLGHRVPKPTAIVIALQDLPAPPANPFYTRRNHILDAADFDTFVEELCAPYYAAGVGRPGVPPGIYFRMLLAGYFEGLATQRAIAWRCADSRSLAAFLGYRACDKTPDHSSLTKIRQRLPVVVHERVFAFALQLAEEHGLIEGKTVGVDSTTLEANAAMKTIVRRDSGLDWKAYLRQLLQAEGNPDPSDDDLRRFDRNRPGKKVSNADWMSPTDPDSRIAKMKDGTTHLAYKAEHVVDLESNLILAAEIYAADQPDSATLLDSVLTAQINLLRADSAAAIEEVVTDRGYHKVETLVECAGAPVRTYIPEMQRSQQRVWTDKPADWERVYRNNRRRSGGERGKKLQRLRSERVERSFAHVCESGGARRSWLRGLVNVAKRYLIQVMGYNLGVIMRHLFGCGTPRSLQGAKFILPCPAQN